MANKSPPIDRGWAWVIVAGLFMKSVISGGFIKSYGIFFAAFTDTFARPASETQLVKAGLSASATLTGPFGTALSERFTERVVVIAGALVMSAALIVSFFANSLEMLIFTFGMLIGIGVSLINGPARVCVGRYFKKRRGLANSLTLVGTAVGQIAVPPFVTFLLATYSLRGTMLIYGSLCLNIIIAGALMRPLKFYSLKCNSERKKAELDKAVCSKNEEKAKNKVNGIVNAVCSVNDETQNKAETFSGTGYAVCLVNGGKSKSTSKLNDMHTPTSTDAVGTNLHSHTADQRDDKENMVENPRELLSSFLNTNGDPSCRNDTEMIAEENASSANTSPQTITSTCTYDQVNKKTSKGKCPDTNGKAVSSHLTTVLGVDDVERSAENVGCAEMHPHPYFETDLESKCERSDGAGGVDNYAYVTHDEKATSGQSKNCIPLKIISQKLEISSDAHQTTNVNEDATYSNKYEGCERSPNITVGERKLEGQMVQLIKTEPSKEGNNAVNQRSRTSPVTLTKLPNNESISVKQDEAVKVKQSEQNASPKKPNVCKTVLAFFRRIFDRRVLLNPLYILFLFCTSVSATAVVNQTIFIVPRAEEVGISREMAAILLSVSGGCDVVGRILLGFLVDVKLLRLHPHLVMAGGIAVTSACMLAFPFITSFAEMAAVAVIFGLCGSTHVVLNLPVMVDIAGEELLAKAVGLSILFNGATAAILAPLLGLVKDKSGSYSTIFYVTSAMEILVVILLVVMELLSRSRRKTVKLV